MNYRILIALLLSGSALLGCDKPEPKPVPKADELKVEASPLLPDLPPAKPIA